VISEKSLFALGAARRVEMGELTLRIQEVAYWHFVVRPIRVDSCVLEHLIDMGLRPNSHVLLTEVLDVSVNIGTGKLFRERYLLERHLVDASAHRAKQRSCSEEGTLHDCDCMIDYHYQSNSSGCKYWLNSQPKLMIDGMRWVEMDGRRRRMEVVGR
jgi:hypothetical protein